MNISYHWLPIFNQYNNDGNGGWWWRVQPVKDAAFAAVITTPYLSLGIYGPLHVAFGSLVSCRRVRQQDFTANSGNRTGMCQFVLSNFCQCVSLKRCCRLHRSDVCATPTLLIRRLFTATVLPPDWFSLTPGSAGCLYTGLLVKGLFPNSHIYSGNIYSQLSVSLCQIVQFSVSLHDNFHYVSWNSSSASHIELTWQEMIYDNYIFVDTSFY